MLHLVVQESYFNNVTFPEQLQLIRETDIVVGIHGVDLTYLSVQDDDSKGSSQDSTVQMFWEFGGASRIPLHKRLWFMSGSKVQRVYKVTCCMITYILVSCGHTAYSKRGASEYKNT
jgi:hypothetical protein